MAFCRPIPIATAIDDTSDTANVCENDRPRTPTSMRRKLPCRAYLIEMRSERSPPGTRMSAEMSENVAVSSPASRRLASYMPCQ